MLDDLMANCDKINTSGAPWAQIPVRLNRKNKCSLRKRPVYYSQAHIQGQHGYFVNRSCVVDTSLSVKTSHKDYTNGRVKCASVFFRLDWMSRTGGAVR